MKNLIRKLRLDIKVSRILSRIISLSLLLAKNKPNLNKKTPPSMAPPNLEKKSSSEVRMQKNKMRLLNKMLTKERLNGNITKSEADDKAKKMLYKTEKLKKSNKMGKNANAQYKAKPQPKIAPTHKRQKISEEPDSQNKKG